MVRVLACLALAASATAFTPSTEVRKMTRLNGYVPDGLSPAEYNAAKAKDNSAANANKSRFPKGKKAVDMDVWVKKMEATQILDGDKILRTGHTYAKNKFEEKSEYDKSVGRGKDSIGKNW